MRQSACPGSLQQSAAPLNGYTVDLERYNLAQLTIWHWLGFAIGLVWVLYWVVPKPGVPRLAVTSQIPLNSDGRDVGLTNRHDHRVANWFAIATLLLLAGGAFYQQVYFPVKIPQQVARFAPVDTPAPPSFANARARHAGFDPASSTLTLDVDVTNTGASEMTLTGFTTSTLTFVNAAPGSPGAEHNFAVDGSPTVEPGQTQLLHLTLRDQAWQDERLIEVGKPQIVVAGQLVFQDSNGMRVRPTIQSNVVPKLYP